MKKGIIGFLTGLFVLAVGFCLTVLIMASANNRNFVDEIKSWGESQNEQVLPDDELPEDIETETGNETETTAIILI